ncbi:dihydrolipoamide acetyltransferase family protein [Phycicoccus sp. SLBN-51]|uniref:dihydrolipoamide acetyltransferase family protein n=1 Tax=Phycicoccus sp. SLBN-51 TaxID=2768447 RepID=UPI0011532F0B|nr:dihydrolipoamide acetyltransferase family protein [Phycicoccus sp. SLBN-51]TQJ49020.1 pyruvate dehydrogenase E2 component (dihydrolipoamide acetyltransferase) [Phycicoccus sp. SLBN-51]
MSIKEFNLPDPGEGLTEAEIVTWKVKAGDTVKVNDIVVEIETAKSLVELPVPFAGTVTELLVPEGETVEVGTPIIAVDTAGGAGEGAPTSVQQAPAAGAVEPGIEGSPAPKMAAAAAAAEAEEQIEEGKIGGTTSTGRTAVLVGYGVKQTEAKRRPRRPGAGAPAGGEGGVAARSQSPFPAEPAVAAPAPAAQPAPAQPAAAQPAAPVVAREGGARALAKPPVRKFAKDLGVDLAQVRGSGEGGIITRADVEAHAAGGQQPQAPAAGEPAAVSEAAAYQAPAFARSGEREQRIPIKGVRKMMAQAMVDSAFTAPHVTEWITVDATATMELVERLKKDREFKDVKVTPLLVLAKAMCVALRRNPEINATWDDAAGEIVVKNYVNLGIAAATPRGLIVPNIKDADQMSMRQLAEAIGALTATAREGRTQPADMSGGTITITNVGVFGVDLGTPIINPGESAIMAFGAIRREPWVITAADGTESIEPRWVTRLALSFDHRLIDGELGSRFLADVAKVMEDPARGLVWG